MAKGLFASKQLFLICASVVFSTFGAQAAWKPTLIDVTGTSNVTSLQGINNNMEAIGFRTDNNAPFLLDLTTMVFTPLAFPADYNSADAFYAALNDNDTLVGSNPANDLLSQTGFFVSKGVFTSFSFHDAATDTDAVFTQPSGINNQGVIVGSAGNAFPFEYGFVYDPATNTFTKIAIPNSIFTIAKGINSNGVLVGSARISGAPCFPWIGWVRSVKGTFTLFCVNGNSTQVGGISEKNGLITGSVYDPALGRTVGFKTTVVAAESGKVRIAQRKLLTFGAASKGIFPAGVTNTGEIAGVLEDDANNLSRGFTATEKK